MARALVAHSELLTKRMALPVLFTLMGLLLTIASANLVFAAITFVLTLGLVVMASRSLVLLRLGSIRPGFGLHWIASEDVRALRLSSGPVGSDSQIVAELDGRSVVLINSPPGLTGRELHASEMRRCLAEIEKHLARNATE